MTAKHHSATTIDNDPQFTATPESKIRISLGALAGIVSVALAGAAVWTWTRADVAANSRSIATHDRRFENIEAKLDAQREVLSEIRADVKALNRERSRVLVVP